MRSAAARKYADEERRCKPYDPNVWSKERIQKMILESDKALKRAIVAIYRLQTDEERNNAVTISHNGVGFGAYDAEFLTDMAKRILRGVELTPKQIAVSRNKMKKYWKQLLAIAKGEINASSAR